MIDTDTSKESADKKSSTAKSGKKASMAVKKKKTPVKAKKAASAKQDILNKSIAGKNTVKVTRTADISSALLEVRHQQVRRAIPGKVGPSALEQRLSGK